MIYSVLRQRHLKEAIHLEDQLARELEAARRRARADIESRRNEERDRLLAVFEQVTKRSVSCTVYTVIIMPQLSFHPSCIWFLLVNLSSLITNPFKFRHKVRNHTRKVKFDVDHDHLFCSTVMPLFTLAGNVGIRVIWPQYSIFFHN